MGPPTPPISPFNDLAIAADAKPAKSTRFLGRILNGKLSADTVSHPSTTKRSASRPTNRYGLPPPKVRHEDRSVVPKLICIFHCISTIGLTMEV